MADGKDIKELKEKALKDIKWYLDNSYGVYRSGGYYHKTPPMYGMVPPLPEELLDDREFAEEAVAINGAVLWELSPRLKTDKELILLAAERCNYIDVKVPEEYFDDREFMLRLVAVQGFFLSKYKTFDKEIIFAAVRNDYDAAAYIRSYDWGLMDDPEFVRELVAVSGRTIKYANERFRDDEEMVLLSLNSYRAFEFASSRLRNDEAFIQKAIERNPSCVAYAPMSYRTDREYMMKLIRIHPYVYRYVKGSLVYDVDLALFAVSKDHTTISFVGRDVFKRSSFVDGVVEIANNSHADVREYLLKAVDKL